jgi:hypothetical protein
MKSIKNNAVLRSELDNTAHKMHKHQGKSMPAQFSKAAQPITFTDFERHCGERFSDDSAYAHLGLSEHISFNATENDFAAISLKVCDVERTRIAAILLVFCSCQVAPSKASDINGCWPLLETNQRGRLG